MLSHDKSLFVTGRHCFPSQMRAPMHNAYDWCVACAGSGVIAQVTVLVNSTFSCYVQFDEGHCGDCSTYFGGGYRDTPCVHASTMRMLIHPEKVTYACVDGGIGCSQHPVCATGPSCDSCVGTVGSNNCTTVAMATAGLVGRTPSEVLFGMSTTGWQYSFQASGMLGIRRCVSRPALQLSHAHNVHMCAQGRCDRVPWCASFKTFRFALFWKCCSEPVKMCRH